MKCALNARLLSAAELTRQNAIFADIGTDHAYLPLFLLEEGRIKYAYCSDVNEGPLASARKNAEEREMTEKMDFILTDGATVLSGNGITDYAICGMGGELIADIIHRAPHLKDSEVNLILQPMSRQSILRSFLAESGFEIRAESYSFDAGKYYVCLLASYTGTCRRIDSVEAELGGSECSFYGRDARIGYLKNLLSSREKVANGKRIAGISEISEENIINALKSKIEELSKEVT